MDSRLAEAHKEITRLRSALYDIASEVTTQWDQNFFHNCSAAEEIAARALLDPPICIVCGLSEPCDLHCPGPDGKEDVCAPLVCQFDPPLKETK